MKQKTTKKERISEQEKDLGAFIQDSNENQYAYDPLIEKIIYPAKHVIRLFRLLQYIAINEKSERGAVHSDIKNQYSHEKHNIDPERRPQENLKDEILKDGSIIRKREVRNEHRDDLRKLEKLGFIRKDDSRKSPRYTLTGEGRRFSRLKIGNNPEEIKTIMHYLKSLDAAMPFNVSEDWIELIQLDESSESHMVPLMENESSAHSEAIELFKNMSPSIQFDSNLSFMKVSGGRILKLNNYRDQIDDHVQKVFWLGISGMLKKSGAREFRKFKIKYRHALKEEIEELDNVIPAFIKQFNKNWYLIALPENIPNKHFTLAFDRIIKLEATEVYIRQEYSNRIGQLKEFWKDKAGLYGFGPKMKIEFNLKNGSRHKNVDYFITNLFHESIEVVTNNDGNRIDTVHNTPVTFYTKDDIYYGPEIWRELRKWGAHNITGVWPKQLYLDLNEDVVFTFGNDDSLLYKEDEYGIRKYQQVLASTRSLLEKINQFDLSSYADNLKGLQDKLLELVVANSELQLLILSTGNSELIYDVELLLSNTESASEKQQLLLWGAIYSRRGGIGSAKWEGKNMLGGILKIVREHLRISSDIK